MGGEGDCMAVLRVVRDSLRSREYRCPGGHRLDGVRGDLYDYVEEMMDEMGLPEDWDADRLAAELPDRWRELRKRQEANWVERGRCQKTIEISMEHEGEYGEIAYPVASGDCVAALGLDEDFEYEHALWERDSERRRIGRVLDDAMRQIPRLESAS